MHTCQPWYFTDFACFCRTILHHSAHCKKGIVIATNISLFQIQMSEHNSLLQLTTVEENYMTIFFSFLAGNFPPHHHTILAINCVHASNWFTHLERTQQINGQNDTSVLTVLLEENLDTLRLILCKILIMLQVKKTSDITAIPAPPWLPLACSLLGLV